MDSFTSAANRPLMVPLPRFGGGVGADLDVGFVPAVEHGEEPKKEGTKSKSEKSRRSGGFWRTTVHFHAYLSSFLTKKKSSGSSFSFIWFFLKFFLLLLWIFTFLAISSLVLQTCQMRVFERKQSRVVFLKEHSGLCF